MKKASLILYAGAIWAFCIGNPRSAVWGQTLVAFPTSWGGTPSTVDATTVASGITGPVTCSRGAGLSAASSATRFNSASWPSAANLNPSGNSYLTFTVTASSGYELNLNGAILSLELGSSGNGPAKYAIYSSVQGFASTDFQIGGDLAPGNHSVVFPTCGYDHLVSIEIRIYGWSASSATGTGGFSALSLSGKVSAAGPRLPSFAAVTVTRITDYSATLGATIVCDGGAPISERGTVLKNSSGVTPADEPIAEGGTTLGTFSHSRSLSPQTRYFFAAYAATANGRGLSEEKEFFTLSAPPASQASGLSAVAASASQIDLSWTAASFPSSGADATGYVLLRASGGTVPTLLSENGQSPQAGANTVIVNASLPGSATMAPVTGLEGNTSYTFLLVPFTWDGVNSATYHYLTSAAPVVRGSTKDGTTSTDYFRSRAGGNWSDTASWESSHDGSHWMAATAVPASSAGTIVIRDGHMLTVDQSVTPATLVVGRGSTLVLSNTGHLGSSSLTTLTLSGTLLCPPEVTSATNGLALQRLTIEEGGLFQNSAGAAGAITISHFIIRNGGTYRHDAVGSGSNGLASDFPGLTRTVEASSNVIISKWSNGGTIPAALPALAWGNLTINVASLGGSWNQNGNLTQVNNLTVQTTGGGSREFRLSGNNSYTLTINGNLTISGGILNTASGSNSGLIYRLRLRGSYNQTGGILKQGNANSLLAFHFEGGGTFSYGGGTFSSGNMEWTIESGSTVTLNSDFSIPSSRTLTIKGILDAGTYVISGAGNIHLEGCLKTAHVNGISASGSLAQSGGLTLGSASTIEFNRSGNQSIAARADYANLVISGSGNKSLEGSAVIGGSLTLSGGYLLLGENNLTVEGSVSGGSNSSYVKTDGTGSLVVNNISSGVKVFAVGNSTYNPLSVSQGSNLAWSVRVSDTVLNIRSSFDSTKAIRRTWHITPSGTPQGATLTFQYNDGDPAQAGSGFLIGEDVKLWHYENGWWQSASLAVAPGGAPGGTRTLTVAGLKHFSPYAISNISGTLTSHSFSFGVQKNAAGNILQWEVPTDSNTRGFEVQRSDDGKSFTVLRFIPAHLQRQEGTAPLRFSYADNDIKEPKVYYRIGQVFWDGKKTLSQVVMVERDSGTGFFWVQPNPARDIVWLCFTNDRRERVMVSLVDMTGRAVENFEVEIPSGLIKISRNISALPPGLYWLRVVTQRSKKTIWKRVLKQ